MEISVIVPCYNSMPILEELVELSIEEFRKMNIQTYEFVLVNDCSPKKETILFLKKIADRFDCVKVVDLAKNTGQANAQVAALNHTTGDIIINMDDDMQTHPKNIPILYNKLMEGGYDLVLGKYFQKKHSFYRRVLTAADDRFEETFLRKPKGMSFTSFWITRRYIVDEIIKYENPYSFMEGLFLRTAGNIANVGIEHFDRSEGRSGYNIFKLIKLWSNFTGFTVLPLRIADGIGALAAFIGVIYAIKTFISKLLNPDMVAGYASMICLLLVFFGITLICIGMVGEYVGRTFMSVNHTPQYVVKNVYTSRGTMTEGAAMAEIEAEKAKAAGIRAGASAENADSEAALQQTITDLQKMLADLQASVQELQNR